MKLSRQARRAMCREMAKNALNAMPAREPRQEFRKSQKLLAKRMYAEVPTNVSDGSILNIYGEPIVGERLP